MAIKTENVQISGDQGTFGGYFAAPEGGPVPGVVVIQEIFGVNAHIREMCERFANAGYAAMAPDLFWSIEPGIELGYTPDDIAKGREIAMGKLNIDHVVGDVKATFAALRARPETAGKKLGVTGYCWGGRITYLASCRLDPDAASSYYGGGVAGLLGEAGGINTPTQFHFGEKDPGIPMNEVEQIKAAVAGNPNCEVFTYPDADHGFNCDHRGSYQEAAAKLAWQRTLDLFGKHLA